MTNTVEQVNPPTGPGLYEMRWTHGTEELRQWQRFGVQEVPGQVGLWAGAITGPLRELPPKPIEHYTGAEWRPAKEDNMNEKPKRKRRDAAKIEARLHDVLYEVERAQEALSGDDPDVGTAWGILDKAITIGKGGDLLDWYRNRTGY